jgi:hypothetical protein
MAPMMQPALMQPLQQPLEARLQVRGPGAVPRLSVASPHALRLHLWSIT